MTTTTRGVSANGAATSTKPATAKAAPGVGRRRQVPWVVFGVLLVLGCTLVFAVASVRLGGGTEVLVLTRPVAAGQVVSPADLRSVRVFAGGGLGLVAATGEAAVVGRPAAVPLVAGSLLVGSEIGAPPASSAGLDVVAVALKAGQFPPDLATGDRVQVVAVGPGPSGLVSSGAASSSSGGAVTPALTSGSGGPVLATVVGLQIPPASSGGDTVISLQVADTNADAVAIAAAGEISLVQLPPGPGGG